MTDEAGRLRRRVEEAKGTLVAAELLLKNFEAKCWHVWGETKFTPIIYPAYSQTAPHWHPGYGGREEDHQIYVPERREPRWTRICSICGKTEVTTSFEEKVVKTPVPKFG